MHERREVAVAGAEHERGDVVALEAELDRVDGHLDVGRVLADAAHALRDLDQLHVVAREHAPVFVEAGPVGVGPADHHPPPFRQRIGDRAEVELAQVELFPRPDREVLVVEEQCDAFFFVVQAVATISATARRRRRVKSGPATRLAR